MKAKDRDYLRKVLIAFKMCMLELRDWDDEDQRYFRKAIRLVQAKRTTNKTKE
jgi:hypothetical protein